MSQNSEDSKNGFSVDVSGWSDRGMTENEASEWSRGQLDVTGPISHGKESGFYNKINGKSDISFVKILHH